MNDNLQKFLNELKNVFEQRLSSVFVFGSNACNDETFNLNLMVVVEDLTPYDLKSISKAVITWTKKKNPSPVFMDKKEWYSSNDVYALEYSDIKDNNKILLGENLIDDMVISPNDLRFQCEQEVKNLLMRLRRLYLLHNDNPNLLKESFVPAFKTSITALRAILRLKKADVPKDVYETLKKVSELGISDILVFEKLANFKNKKCDISKKDTEAIFSELISSVRSLLSYVNDL